MTETSQQQKSLFIIRIYDYDVAKGTYYYEMENKIGIEKLLIKDDPDSAKGGIFYAEDGSWIEVWKDGPQMPAGIMLQVVVEDADAMASYAKQNGLSPRGPMVADGEQLYSLVAPGGLVITFQSKIKDQ